MGRVLWFVALALMAACAQPTAPAEGPLASAISTEPLIRGVITAEQQGGFRVEARSTGAYEVDVAVVRADKETKVQPAGARWESLAVGQTVSVWVKGPVMESLPVQAVAETDVAE